MCQLVELEDVLIPEVQRSIHFVGEHTLGKSEAHIFRVCDAGAGHSTLNLTFCCGEVEPSDILGVLRLPTGGQCHHKHGRLIEIRREVLSVIGLVHFHAVVVNHAVAGHSASTAVNKQDGSFDTVQIFQLLHTGTAAVEIHIVVTTDFLQVGKVGNDRGLLTTEG